MTLHSIGQAAPALRHGAWDECFNEHPFTTPPEARTILEAWRNDDNTKRPHSSLDGLTSTAFAPPALQGA